MRESLSGELIISRQWSPLDTRNPTIGRQIENAKKLVAKKHQINTTQLRGRADFENCFVSHRQNKAQKTPYPLYSIDAPFPKLDVAGSSPVSRSKRIKASYLLHFVLLSGPIWSNPLKFHHSACWNTQGDAELVSGNDRETLPITEPTPTAEHPASEESGCPASVVGRRSGCIRG